MERKRVLLTGANGYIGLRLLPLLVEKGYEVVALVRSKNRLAIPENLREHVSVFESDLRSAFELPQDIVAAYYLVHSMSDDPEQFAKRDKEAAENFRAAVEKTACKQVIYLSGLVNDPQLSAHLFSRFEVEKILSGSSIALTTLRASIIIGSGSASFEIVRDLVEKLPVMIAPKWVSQLCQPIAIADVLDYLVFVLENDKCRAQSFDIGGPEKMAYKEVMQRFAKKRGLKRLIISVPFFTPRLSSYWLIFITSTNYYLARNLIDSLKNNSICMENKMEILYLKKLLTLEEAFDLAFEKIAQNAVISSWRDSWSASHFTKGLEEMIEVPKFGCLSEVHVFPFNQNPDKVMEQAFKLGGKRGYYLNWAWKLRGVIDRAFGGVGIRRGKTARKTPEPGQALDFWRVLIADPKQRRFLLYAEMKIPGEAWLEFKIVEDSGQFSLIETATFRPKGILGRLYWYLLLPIHKVIFPGMGKRILSESSTEK